MQFTPCQNRLLLYRYSERLSQLVEVSRHMTSAPSLVDLINLQFLEFKRLLTSIFSSQKITTGHFGFAEECKLWPQVFPTVYAAQLPIDTDTESQTGGERSP